jgi:hypothetical protein
VSSSPVYGEVNSIQHYVIKFVGDLRQVSGFLRVLRFLPHHTITTTTALSKQGLSTKGIRKYFGSHNFVSYIIRCREISGVGLNKFYCSNKSKSSFVIVMFLLWYRKLFRLVIFYISWKLAIGSINDIYETLTRFLSMKLCKSDIIQKLWFDCDSL